MTFFDQEVHNTLAAVTSIDLLENGCPTARRRWQESQLSNLLAHASRNSSFWKKRLPAGAIQIDQLCLLPILTRQQLASQIDREGPLVRTKAIKSYTTSGSTGVPVSVFHTESNVIYHAARTLAEYLMQGLSFGENLTEIASISMGNKRLIVQEKPFWAGPFAEIFPNGSYKKIDYSHDDAALVAELSAKRVGYLKSPSSFVEKLLNYGGTSILHELGVSGWAHLSDARDPFLLSTLKEAGIRCYSNYSSGEVGLIATQCPRVDDSYHLVTSNVIVELDKSVTMEFRGEKVSRLLITHLHSYATPIIRYDVGDLATLDCQCVCGHNGPALRNIVGRKKNFVQLSNAELLPFHGRAHEIFREIKHSDGRIRQTQPGELIVEIVVPAPLRASQKEGIQERLRLITDPSIKIQIVEVEYIDWGASPKRLFFSSLA